MDSPGERLRALRKKKGLSTAELALRVGKSESAVRNQENGTNGIPAGLAVQYGKILDSTAQYILTGEEPKPSSGRYVPHFLPVRYRVQAGHWYEMGFEEPPEAFDVPVLPNPRFAEWPQWLEKVVGPSANKKYPDGIYVHVVDAIEMGYEPQDGHWVVVERRRAGGHVRERTVKQIEVTAEGEVRLWPRSTDPRFQEPIDLRAGRRRVRGDRGRGRRPGRTARITDPRTARRRPVSLFGTSQKMRARIAALIRAGPQGAG